MKDLIFSVSLLLAVSIVAATAADPKSPIVVKVNGVAITKADLAFAASQQGISENNLVEMQPTLIDQQIERQLIRSFLTSRKIEPIAEELQFQIAKAEELIRKRGEDPQKLLAKLGYTPERLKRELGLPIAWKVFATQTISDQQIKDYFNQHKLELDGTQLRASQIFLKLSKSPSDEDVAAKKMQLLDLRSEIIANKLTFAEAAMKSSEAPSKQQGGDVGLFGWRGKLPAAVSQAAFTLKVGEVSEPIVSPFGVHLIEVTERHPGDFSIEDVRPIIIEELSQELWKSTVARELKTANARAFTVQPFFEADIF
jgi:parvulin-like peptidyl-prolyl isomerase